MKNRQFAYLGGFYKVPAYTFEVQKNCLPLIVLVKSDICSYYCI